jgi:uncharacterized protein involved in exopolysaccharide biosynthesis
MYREPVRDRPAQASRDPGADVDLFTLLAALRARIGLFLLVVSSTLLVAAVLCMAMPKSFRATATLLVSEPMGGHASAERGAQMQTLADMLTSENIARRVVKILQLADNPQARTAYERERLSGSFDDWLIVKWLTAPKVELGQGGLVRIKVDAPAAATAAAIANAYGQAYFDLARVLQVDNVGRTQALLDGHLATLRNDLAQAQSRLVAYQHLHGIVSADSNSDPSGLRLTDLAAQLSKAQQLSLEQANRQQLLQQWQAHAGTPDQLHEIQTDVQVQRLNGELQLSEAKLEELSSQYGSAHPSYQLQAADTERRRKALQSQITSLLAGFDQTAAQGRWRTGALEHELATQRSRLLADQSVRSELASLANRVDSAQHTYDMAVQRFVIEMVASQVFHASVSLLNAASVPLEPRSPKVFIFFGGGLMGGIGLGLALVAGLEALDRRVRSAVDLRLLPAEQAIPMLGMTSRWRPPSYLLAARAVQGPMLNHQQSCAPDGSCVSVHHPA